MRFTLKSAARYLAVGPARASRGFVNFIKQVSRVFSFTQERANRLVRYMRVLRDYRRGDDLNEIAARYGCSRSTVLRYARLAEEPRRERGFDPTVREAVIGMYKARKPVAEIARKCNVSQAYVSKTATEEGISRKKDRRRAPK